MNLYIVSDGHSVIGVTSPDAELPKDVTVTVVDYTEFGKPDDKVLIKQPDGSHTAAIVSVWPVRRAAIEITDNRGQLEFEL